MISQCVIVETALEDAYNNNLCLPAHEKVWTHIYELIYTLV